MILVALDTSTRYAGVGVQNDEGVRSVRSWRSDRNHGRELMPALIESLHELSLAATDITHVAVAIGPGGFSAVRVGISASLGLAVARKLPVLGIPTHEIEIEPYRSLITARTPVYSVLPAGRGEISWMCHNVASLEKPSEQRIGVSAPAEFVDLVEPGALICGEASDLLVSMIDENRFAALPANPSTPRRDPGSILDIALKNFRDGVTTPYPQLRPIYARPPSISQPKPQK
ncbi:MAG: tRNA (adenosine(37)-N6)-threonylcarbamoyltransferase complex dimerization subunit type 1 TsaB [Chloroflexi bacterium]|nr:tRNA (adenosine(37)-N6)-threonylcarbamoyltransferase complex dimerization subunit type 1 TsaB [Chloroflexota bacterium]